MKRFVLLLSAFQLFSFSAWASIDPDAQAFCTLAEISDSTAVSNMSGLVIELKTAGYWANLVDGVILKPPYNPTNNYSLRGRTFVQSNLTYTSFGGLFNGSVVHLDGLPDLRTNTMVIVWRYPVTEILSMNGWLVGAIDTNTGSAVWENVYSAGGVENHLGYNVETNWLSSEGNQGSNFVFITRPDNTLNQVDYIYGYRVVDTLALSGTNYTTYRMGLENQIGFSAHTVGGKARLPQTSQLNSLFIGFGPLQGLRNAYTGGDFFRGEVASVLVFNCYVSDDLVRAATRASRWLDLETVDRVYAGDSRMAIGPALGFSATNSYIWYLQGGHTNSDCWINSAIGGTTASAYNTTVFSNYCLAAGLISKITSAELYEGHGINDLAFGQTGLATFQQITNIFNMAKLKDSRWLSIPIPTWTVWTNVGTYGTVAVESNRLILDALIRTNRAMFAGMPQFDLVCNRFIMDTNNIYSNDGLHMFTANSYLFWPYQVNTWKGIGDFGDCPLAKYPGDAGWNLTYTNTTCTPYVPRTWFVRPGVFTSLDSQSHPVPTAGVYGTQDGTSYANAWNGITSIVWGNGGVTNTDTLYICGTNIYNMLDTPFPTYTNWFAQGVSVMTVSGVTIRMDYTNGDRGLLFGGAFNKFNAASVYGGPDVNGIYDQQLLNVNLGTSFAAPMFEVTGNLIARLPQQASPAFTGSGQYYSILATKNYVHRSDNAACTPNNIAEQYYGWAIDMNYQSNIVWIGCNFVSASFEDYSFGALRHQKPNYATGLALHDIMFTNCTFRDSQTFRIFPLEDNFSFYNCSFIHQPDGVYTITDTQPFGPNHLVVSNCYFENMGSAEYNDSDNHAIGIQSGNFHLIVGNTTTNTGAAIVLYSPGSDMKSNVVAYNYITDTHVNPQGVSDGISISGDNANATAGHRTGNKIYYNIIRNLDPGSRFTYQGDGISCNSPDYTEIFNNSIYNANIGIDYEVGPAGGTVNARIVNNIIINSVSKAYYLIGHAAATNLVMDNNLYFPLVTWTNSVVSPAAVVDQNSVFAGPLLVQAAPIGPNDFKLQQASPAVSHGTITTPSQDYDKTSLNNPPAIGAFDNIGVFYVTQSVGTNSISLASFNSGTNVPSTGQFIFVGLFTNACVVNQSSIGMDLTAAQFIAPVFSPAAISVAGRHDVHMTNGYIANTANGSPPLANQMASTGISVVGCPNLVISGVVITNMYVRTVFSEENRLGEGIDITDGSNVLVQNCNLSQGDTMLAYDYSTGSVNNLTLRGNVMTACNHALQVKTSAINAFLSNVTISSNSVENQIVWDESGSALHTDAFIFYNEGKISGTNYVSGMMSNVMIFGNRFGTNFGKANTAAIFFDVYDLSEWVHIYIYNNLFLASSNYWNNGLVNVEGTDILVANNTFIGFSQPDPLNGGTGLALKQLRGTRVVNNMFDLTGFEINLLLTNGFSTDYNLYNRCSITGAFVAPGNVQLDPGSWFSFIAPYDTHSTQPYPFRLCLDSAYKPLPGVTNGIAAGTNLTYLGITNDYFGNARPATGAWTIGYSQAGGTPPPPQPPVISTQPQDVSNLTNQTASFFITVAGDAPLYYKWQFTNGTAVTNFNLVSAWTTNSPTPLTNYFNCIVSNSSGFATSTVATWRNTNGTAGNFGPVIAVQPINQITLRGITATFSLTVTGQPTIYYQWQYTNGSPVTNFNASPTWTTNRSASSLTNYFRCYVTNLYGTATSSNVYWYNTNQPPDQLAQGLFFPAFKIH